MMTLSERLNDLQKKEVRLQDDVTDVRKKVEELTGHVQGRPLGPLDVYKISLKAVQDYLIAAKENAESTEVVDD